MNKVSVTSDTAGLLRRLIEDGKYKSICVITDNNTTEHCFPVIREVVKNKGIQITIPAGEEFKNLDTCTRIWSYMTDARLDRKSLVINLGGGVIGDMGGFCASTYKRGIDFIQIPTTLLSQVDASVGGKLGIDFAGSQGFVFKNHIGVFKVPSHVIIDTQFLKTLSPRELRSGFAEIIKHCLIADKAQWDNIKRKGLSEQDLNALVAHSVDIKDKITTADPEESGLRKILNFGHTIGHAIESFYLPTKKKLLHGEAIAVGMICEAYLSVKKGFISENEFSEIAQYLFKIYGTHDIADKDIAKIVPLTLQDKKTEGDVVLFSLLEKVGKANYNIAINADEMIESIEAYRKLVKNTMNTTATLLEIKKHSKKINATVLPPSSKSESNRVLIIDALTGKKCTLDNLSNARDTQTMIRLLKSDDKELNVLDAGTTMRFLTAYTAVSGRESILTGTHRMLERPIKLLVDALRDLGCSINYLQNEGFPPIEIKKFNKENVKTNRISIRGDVSSQYITALLMVAPTLPQGIELQLEGKVGSRPYIEMTLALMKLFGIQAQTDWNANKITIQHQDYVPSTYSVESDWSGASYWFSIVALSDDARIVLKGYKEDSLQGDRIITEIAKNFGVVSSFTSEGLVLEKGPSVQRFSWDFTHCPDLAQTVAVVCAAKGIECTMTGLESLRIKETDRIAALQNELQKFGGNLKETVKDEEFKVTYNNFKVSGQTVATYKDHRMAMAFAPLCLLGDVSIEAPDVVEKSYPHYWEDLKSIGIKL